MLPFFFHMKGGKTSIYCLTYKVSDCFFVCMEAAGTLPAKRFQNINLFSSPFLITPSISGGLAQCSSIRLPETIRSIPINLKIQSWCLNRSSIWLVLQPLDSDQGVRPFRQWRSFLVFLHGLVFNTVLTPSDLNPVHKIKRWWIVSGSTETH